MANGDPERRTDLAKDVGYIKGIVESVEKKMDKFIDTSNEKMKDNSERVGVLEKRIDKYSNYGIAVFAVLSVGWTVLIVQGDKVRLFFHHLINGG